MSNPSIFDLFGEDEFGAMGHTSIASAASTDALTQIAPLYDPLDAALFRDPSNAAPAATAATGQTAATAAASAVLASVATIGNYIAYTSPSSSSGHHFAAGSTVTVNLTGLTIAGELYEARTALAAWASVANIKFVETTGAGQITITDDANNTTYDAYTNTSWSGPTLLSSADVHITQKWYNNNGGAGGTVGIINSYGYQTYLHELGHALGLGHTGPYNGSATYGVDNIYTNDSWQYSVMSYFDQSKFGGASYTYVSSAMQADIYGIQQLYGASTVNNGNTVYGFNATAGAVYNFSLGVKSFTIYDGGGINTLDLSGFTQTQIINLNGGSFSSVGGLVNNISIAAGTIIGTVIGGSGNDTFYAGSGICSLNGGAGLDKAVFNMISTADTIVAYNGVVGVLNQSAHLADSLTSIETLQFTDKSIAASTVQQFNALDYIAGYDDLITAFGTNTTAAFQNYVTTGFFNGRGQGGFDGWQYMASYKDLIVGLTHTEAAAAQHFVSAGFFEGRVRDSFAGDQYLATYDDLITGVAHNDTAAAWHFVNAGFGEGRTADGFDAYRYIASNVDLIKAFSSPNAAAIDAAGAHHFVNAGYFEGRSRGTFNASQYLANYADLRAAFGTNLQAAELHFIQAGYFEGRTDHV